MMEKMLEKNVQNLRTIVGISNKVMKLTLISGTIKKHKNT